MDQLIYKTYARYYDVIYRDYLRDSVPRLVDFIVNVFSIDAERNVKDVLDVACGTGGPTIELAKRGYTLVGVDINREVIEIARRKAAELDISVRFEVGDMRKLQFNNDFDAAMCIFTSINYNLTDEDILATLRGIHRSLRKGGVFIADFPNPLMAERWFYGTPIIWRVDEENRSILIIDSVLMNRVTLMIDWVRTLIVHEQGQVKMIPDRHRLRAYTANEMKLLARMAGFRKVKIYGDMNISEEPPRHARRLFLVAVK